MTTVTLSLIGARLRVARGRQLAVVAALATATAIPILISGSTAVTTDAALGRGLASLPSGARSVVASYNGFLDSAASAHADAVARRELPTLVDGTIERQLEYRPLADSTGQTFVLAGRDDLASGIRITDGRAPHSCTPTRCEVVVISAPDAREPVLRSGYGLVVVGHAVRSDPFLLSGTFDPGRQTPLVLGDGVNAVASIAPLGLIARTYSWVAPLDRKAIIGRGVDAWTRTATEVADRLSSAGAGMALVVPDQTVRTEVDTADSSARRFGLLAGGCAVLLLGSAVIGGAALRPDGIRFVTALRRRGLSPNRIRAVVVGETAALTLTAALIGILLGTGIAAILAQHAQLDVMGTAREAARAGLPAVAGLGLGAFVLLMLTLWPRTGKPDDVNERIAWRVVSGAAFGCLLALLLVGSRGAAAPDPGGRGDPLLITLPALVLLTLGLATARTWPWLLRFSDRLLPTRAVEARLGIAGIAARPLLAASTVALLAAAVGATGFAASYRSTLERGATDQADFAVPLDARITVGSGLRPVLNVASVAEYQQLAPGSHAVPVLRQAGSIRIRSTGAEVVQFVGLDPQALPDLRRWSNVIGGSSPSTVRRAIGTTVPARGIPLPAGKRLQIRLASTLPDVVVAAWLLADDGRERSVVMEPGDDSRSLTALLPGAGSDAASESAANQASHWRLTSLTFRQPTDAETHRQHNLGEGQTTTQVPSGRIAFGVLQIDDKVLPGAWSGWNGTGLAVTAGGSGAVLNYQLTATTLVINASRPGAGASGSAEPLPVAADPVTAAAGPLITATLNGVAVQARVVATLPRFPTVTGRFVVADEAALSSLVDRTSPGLGQPGEIWFGLPESSSSGASQVASAAVRARLADAPFSGVDARWAMDLERGLRTDPIARGAEQLLFLAALLTMLVALAALVLLVIGERVEDAAELYTWEANGVRPGVLRRALWVRAVLVAVVAVPAGVIGGLVLTRLTARLVNLTAGAQIPQPPLVPVAGLGTALPAVAVGLGLALGVAGLVAATAFREPEPVLDPASARRRWR